ncbi:MAG: DUF3293 domain-containing protein [Saprospiraceae bacterium]|nr:DUF3293 domain-containing protein [Saprospiraceae bacterium]
MKDFEKIYTETTYCIPRVGITFMVGEPNEQLNLFLQRHDSRYFIFFSAHNPNGHPEDESVNSENHLILKKVVQDMKLDFLEGYGRGLYGWKDEISLFIFNATLDMGQDLAIRFRQKAFIYGEINKAPILIWTKSQNKKPS